jgi:hypothetical protein
MQVQAAGMFSLQMDNNSKYFIQRYQWSIIVRYVTDNCVNERLLAVVECGSSTGKDMFSLVDLVLKSSNIIDITKCIGNSTDGAANMQDQYNGFSSWHSKESPRQIHVLCYAYVLNLVLGDYTKAVIQSASLYLAYCMTWRYFFANPINVWISGSKLKRAEILKDSQLLEKHVGGLKTQLWFIFKL